jgi:Fur family transcriptional regulator, peroxide stress response regulator
MQNHSAISLLRKKGYRVTPQRIAVLEILGNSKGHRTAIEIYEQAVMVIPGISEATIYRTLEFFGKEGIVFVSTWKAHRWVTS